MRLIKKIHSFLGLLPFIWLVFFLLLLLIGTLHFGYAPKEGNPVDPYELGLDWLSVIITIYAVFALI